MFWDSVRHRKMYRMHARHRGVLGVGLQGLHWLVFCVCAVSLRLVCVLDCVEMEKEFVG